MPFRNGKVQHSIRVLVSFQDPLPSLLTLSFSQRQFDCPFPVTGRAPIQFMLGMFQDGSGLLGLLAQLRRILQKPQHDVGIQQVGHRRASRNSSRGASTSGAMLVTNPFAPSGVRDFCASGVDSVTSSNLTALQRRAQTSRTSLLNGLCVG